MVDPHNSEINRLKQIVSELRGPGGCPWDQEQTMQSITPHIIEEAYELVDAIQADHTTDIQEELGDVLLHIVMLCQMASESKKFEFEDVAKGSADKMVRRHPHVFGDKSADTVEEVWENWDNIKSKEKAEARLFDNIPKSLPSLLQAQKIQKKAARVGFDWPDLEGPIDKIKEELKEFQDELEKKEKDPQRLHEEYGDLLFSIVNVGRKIGINTEESLRDCNLRFWDRFYVMEDLIQTDQKEVSKMALEELDSYWEKAKIQNKIDESR